MDEDAKQTRNFEEIFSGRYEATPAPSGWQSAPEQISPNISP